MAAKFGPGGNSKSFYDAGFRSTLQAPRFVSERGLDLYEYEAGNGISGSMENFRAIGQECAKYGVIPSFHTPYFISLSSTEEEKRIKSVEYIRQSAAASDALGARVMVVHSGSAAKIPRETAMEYASQTLRMADEMLEEGGYKVRLGLETMGKLNQLGTLDEVITLCGISARFCPVVDFGHMNARENGLFYTADDYKRVFDTISSRLGAQYAENLHCHFSKIMYTSMGEKKHLTFEDTQYGPQFEPLMDAIIDLGVSPTIICESAGTMAEDAACMKQYYEGNKKSQTHCE